MTETSGRQTGRDVEVKRAVSTFLLAPDLDYQQPYKSCPTKIIMAMRSSSVMMMMMMMMMMIVMNVIVGVMMISSVGDLITRLRLM